jgi:hypothetical protein
MRAAEVLFGEEDADLSCGGGGCAGACDGGLDDGRQVEDFFALEMLVWRGRVTKEQTYRVGGTGLAEEHLLAISYGWDA